jgi:hypothetical protein
MTDLIIIDSKKIGKEFKDLTVADVVVYLTENSHWHGWLWTTEEELEDDLRQEFLDLISKEKQTAILLDLDKAEISLLEIDIEIHKEVKEVSSFDLKIKRD